MELLFKHLFKRELLWFLLLFYSTPFKFVQGTIIQMPSHACVGEDITIDCDFSVPDPNNNFRTNIITFIVGSENGTIPDDEVNVNTGVHGGVDLSRLTAIANNSFSNDKIIRGSITLSSYTASDAGIRLGCAAIYYISGFTAPTDAVRETTLLTPAAPPSALSMLSISDSDIDPNTCSATVSLNWIPPSYTNRTVDRYYLSLQNGTALDSITASANSYSYNTTLLLDTVYAYSVSASSCAGNSTQATSYLNPNTPPSPLNSLQSSISNFNTATCSADISLSWNTPLSNIPINRYFLYLDGSPLATTNSNSYIHFTILNINTNYQYSVTAMNCAGNSTTSGISVPIRIAGYSLTESLQFACLAYDNDTGILTNSWRLSSTPTQPSGVSGLDITYSLQLLYSHSRQGVTHTYTDSTNFTLPSSQLSYNTVLTAHNFTQLDRVETNITANLTIVQQCGQSFNGTAMECFFDSNNPPIPPTPSTNITNPTVPVIPNNSIGAIVGGVVGGCLLLIIIIIILIILAICISFFRKGTNKSLKPTHFGMEECDSISPTHKGPVHYSKTAETNTNEEMNYAQIDHSMSKGSAVRPPAIPSTNYADIGSFPESTHYTTVNEPN